jgi:nucleotide-binding universal stress UspA family protein
MILPGPRIVVATSGSGASRQATQSAARLASAFGAELTIVHVVPAVEYRTGRLTPTLPIAQQLGDPYASLVLLDARRLASAQGATVRPVLIAGEPRRRSSPWPADWWRTYWSWARSRVAGRWACWPRRDAGSKLTRRARC